MTESKLRVLVVDDEPLARRGLIRLLDAQEGFEVVAECGNGLEAVQLLQREEFDLVLLDVEMPELDGFGVLEQVGADAMPPVILVTAFEQYAIRAFDAHALDYVMKPVDPKRFAQALERVQAAVHALAAKDHLQGLLRELGTSDQSPKRIAARTGGQTLLVPIDEIDWLQVADNYVRLHVGERVILHRETLAHLVGRLDPARFLRVHRSHAVNLDRVSEVHSAGHGDALILMQDGSQLPVSRRYRTALLQVFGDGSPGATDAEH